MNIGTGKFLAYVEAIAAEKPTYRKGGYGADGTCDCIGLIIGAVRRAGGSWRGMHGTNHTAREEVDGLRRIVGTGDLQRGTLVFKARAPGHRQYDLPARYDSSKDRNDYYHVGVVVSVYPLQIRHMSTKGPAMDTSIGSWEYHGWLKKIRKESEGQNMTNENAAVQPVETVTISGGNVKAPINMRAGTGTDRKIIRTVPQNAEATLLMYGEKWCLVRYQGTEGYVASEFIHRGGTPLPVPVDQNPDYVSVKREEIRKVYEIIGEWLLAKG